MCPMCLCVLRKINLFANKGMFDHIIFTRY
jgi:hypothetical protein